MAIRDGWPVLVGIGLAVGLKVVLFEELGWAGWLYTSPDPLLRLAGSSPSHTFDHEETVSWNGPLVYWRGGLPGI